MEFPEPSPRVIGTSSIPTRTWPRIPRSCCAIHGFWSKKIWPMTRSPNRTILHVLKKEKFGEAISDIFTKECDQDDVDAKPAPSEDKDPMNAKDLLATGPGEIAMLQNKQSWREVFCLNIESLLTKFFAMSPFWF